MVPKKWKKPAHGDGAPPERSSKQKKRAEPPPPNTTFRSRRITWRYLESGDPIGPTRDMESRFEDDDLHEDDCPHTDHMEFFTFTRSTAALEDVQEGAALADHVDDLVNINDTFAAQVKQGCEDVQDAVVKEVTGGAVPTAALPSGVLSIMRQVRPETWALPGHPGQSNDPTGTHLDVKGFFQAVAERERAEVNEENCSEAFENVGHEVTALALGTTFASKDVAMAAARVRSQVSMRVVPGTSHACKVLCCRSRTDMRAKEGSDVAGVPVERGAIWSSPGCSAVIQVRVTLHPHPSLFTTIAPITMPLTLHPRPLPSHFSLTRHPHPSPLTDAGSHGASDPAWVVVSHKLHQGSIRSLATWPRSSHEQACPNEPPAVVSGGLPNSHAEG